MPQKLIISSLKGLAPLRKAIPGLYYVNADGYLRYYSTEQSVVDRFSPGIRSPFENPRRIRPSMNIMTAESNNVEEDAKLLSSKFEGIGEEASRRAEEIAVSENIENFSRKAEKVTAAEKVKDKTEEIWEQPPIAAATSGVSGRASFMTRLGLGKIDDNLPPEEKRRLRIERNTKAGMMFLAFGSAAGLIWFCLHYGRSKRDESGAVLLDRYSGSLLAPFYRIGDGFRDWMNYAVEPSREKLLPDPLKAPYIQPKYTLVIEMKNVLVSPEWTYKTGYRFKKRPALEYFLDVVGYPNFELVIYTSEPPMSAYGVIDNMDGKQRIMYRLFRDCTKYTNGHHVKDLNRLNRDLSKVIFIDFDPESAKYNPENLLLLPKWDGDMDDVALVDLAELLKTIYVSDVDDVRPVLQFYSGFDNPTKEFRRRATELSVMEQQRKDQQQNQSSLRKYAGFFGLRRHNI